MSAKFNRRFQLWAYTVSHGQLLLRSTASDGHKTRIDVLFKDVKAMLVRKHYDSLEVREAESPEETEAIRAATGVSPDKHVRYFVIEGEPRSFVVAGSMASAEDTGSYADPSPLFEKTGL